MRLTTSRPSCTECHEIWESKPPVTLWATPGLLRDTFTFYLAFISLFAVPAVCAEDADKTRSPKVITQQEELPLRDVSLLRWEVGQVKSDRFCSPLGKQSLRCSLSISKLLLERFTQRKKKTLRKIIIIIIIIITKTILC